MAETRTIRRTADGSALSALTSRVRTATAILLPTMARAAIAGAGTADLIGQCARAARASEDSAELWLLLTAVAGVMPRTTEFTTARRTLALAEPGAELAAILDAATPAAMGNPALHRDFSVIADAVFMDVDFSARHGLNTGVQRVVRETARRWTTDHVVRLLAWTSDGAMTRSLTLDEESRVIDWTSDRRHDRAPFPAGDVAPFVVPWRSTIVEPEVTAVRNWERLACAAEFSGNRVVLVGHDAIPLTSAEFVVPEAVDGFIRYLSVVKHSSAVLANSASTAAEFEGFVSAVNVQGIRGPRVEAVALPVDVPADDPASGVPLERTTDLPMILSVGTQEPRKNQLGLLAAAEILWNEGRQFELVFVGGDAFPLSAPFDREIQRLKRAGRPITLFRHASDSILAEAYREARFSVFVSLHEGFGLPVAESLAHGTPVITGDFGSTAEIAAAGGCLVVDPRNDTAIADAMRTLLCNDSELERLAAAARARPARTWDDYARQLWDAATEAARPTEASPSDRAASTVPHPQQQIDDAFVRDLTAFGVDADTARLAAALNAAPGAATVWLVLAALEKALPTADRVLDALRMLARDGAAAVVASAQARGKQGGRADRTVELVRAPILVDVAHTSGTALSTGIQRVARQTVRRWVDRDITLVTWTRDGTAMRRLDAAERATALNAAPPARYGAARDDSIVVPIGGHYILPELAVESWRTSRLLALARYAGIDTSVIGFDCVPLTSAETVGTGMPAAFAGTLGFEAAVSRIATISDAAAAEYRGWRAMLAPTGRPGPDVRSVGLAADAPASTEQDSAEFAALARLDEQPLVLVVGSHEPRKNHMSILFAAERLWREGLAFRLVFVGGNAWRSEEFSDRLDLLAAAGRSVVSLSAVPDRLLGAAYRRASFTVFPSLNEGFGLPIAESLASGTPVVTSNYGSMRDIGEGNGAVLVDPRDDADIVRAMRSLLSDPERLRALEDEAARYSPRDWDGYSDELWSYFVG